MRNVTTSLDIGVCVDQRSISVFVAPFTPSPPDPSRSLEALETRTAPPAPTDAARAIDAGVPIMSSPITAPKTARPSANFISEQRAKQKALFAAVDLDGNGQLSQKELDEAGVGIGVEEDSFCVCTSCCTCCCETHRIPS